MKQHIGISIAVQTPPPFLVVLCRFPSFLNPNINTILILLMLDIGFILPIKAKQSKESILSILSDFRFRAGQK